MSSAMSKPERMYDLVAIGRSSIDLYANQIGVPFTDVESFGAFVGGCPTNICVGATRLGLRCALLTAVGDDPVGEFVLAFLDREGVDTSFVPTKPGSRTSAVLLAIEPPDRFPLVFYREGCADVQIDIDDVRATPIADSAALVVTGTGLCQEPSRSATLSAAEIAQAAGTTVFLDVDFRPNLWADVRAFGVAVRSLLRLVDVVIGTEDELRAATSTDRAAVAVEGSQFTGASVTGDLSAAVELMLAHGAQVVVVKRGALGASIFHPGQPAIDVAPFATSVVNVLGAGDAFAAGLIYGRAQGWSWEKAARMGNATGAIVVGRQGCANFMPTSEEALEFIDAAGGF